MDDAERRSRGRGDRKSRSGRGSGASDAVLRILRGEPLEILARELSVTAAELSAWRDVFLETGGGKPEDEARDDGRRVDRRGARLECRACAGDAPEPAAPAAQGDVVRR